MKPDIFHSRVAVQSENNVKTTPTSHWNKKHCYHHLKSHMRTNAVASSDYLASPSVETTKQSQSLPYYHPIEDNESYKQISTRIECTTSFAKVPNKIITVNQSSLNLENLLQHNDTPIASATVTINLISSKNNSSLTNNGILSYN